MDPVHDVTDSQVADLVDTADSLNLCSRDLDDSIYEVANAYAAARYNDGDLSDLDDDDAYAAVHDDADREASAINNGDLPSQLRFLAEQWGLEVTVDHLRSLDRDPVGT